MTNFKVRFYDVPFLLDSQERINLSAAELPLADTRLTLQSRKPSYWQQGLTYDLDEAKRMPLRMGQFFYPATIRKWGEYIGIMGSEQVAELKGITSGPLVINQGDVTIETEMHLLQTRLINGEDPEGLYLVQLVDDRYFLHQRYTDENIYKYLDTWSDLISYLASCLGISLSVDSISANYGCPEFDSDLLAFFEDASILLDAVLYNVGMVGIRNLDGTYSAKTIANAVTLFEENKNLDAVHLAGTPTFAPVLPEYVQVTFPNFVQKGSYYPYGRKNHLGYPINIGNLYDVVVPSSSVGYPVSVPGTTKVFHDLYRALYSLPTDLIPANLSNLQNLAEQIAKDFLGQQFLGMDVSYPNIAPWTPDGLTDMQILWDHNHCLTRIKTKPVNEYPEELLHGDCHLHRPGTNVFADTVGEGGAELWLNPNVKKDYADTTGEGGSELWLNPNIRKDYADATGEGGSELWLNPNIRKYSGDTSGEGGSELWLTAKPSYADTSGEGGTELWLAAKYNYSDTSGDGGAECWFSTMPFIESYSFDGCELTINWTYASGSDGCSSCYFQ